jgi:hypothetical protein
VALFALADRFLGHPLRQPPPGLSQALLGLLLLILWLILCLPASMALGVLTVHEIARRVLIHRGVIPYLSLREIFGDRGFPEHWYATEPPEVKPRLKPRYAAVVEGLQIAVFLLGAGSGGLAMYSTATAIGFDWDGWPRGTRGDVATFVLLVLIFVATCFLTCLLLGWLLGRNLVRRGLLSRGDLRGFLLGTSYPPAWCTTEPLPRPTPRPFRESLRFSVRGLVGVVAVVALGLALVVNATRAEWQAAVALRGRGGTVWYDWQYSPTNRPVGIANPRWQRWVERVGLGSPLGARLVIAPRATNDDLVHVGRLGWLNALDLSGSAVTDVGLARLGGLADLQAVCLDSTPITGTGLAHLAGSRRLDWLSLIKTRLGDHGMVQVMNFPELTYLDLTDSPVTDVGLDHLSGLHKLGTLNLKGTEVTDAGMTQLGQLKSLVRLNLSDTKVTDRGLCRLKSLTSLRTLGLKQTAVTAEGAAELQQALPALRIVR